MIVEKDDWSTPTLREVPFWRKGMTQEEYDIEREYHARNFHLVRQGLYTPLWKQKNQNTTSQ